MARGNTYFISDLHLGANYLPDTHENERKAVRFLESIRDDAEALYMLGDVLDYWYEYRTVVPRGYVRFFGALASLADAGVKIYWFIGNHDIWLFDYLRDEIGIEVIDGYEITDIGGKRFFLSHGDGLGRLDTGFRLIRSLFRNRICQKLFSSIHPRWTIPFAHRWSSHSRNFQSEDVPKFRGEQEPLVQFASQYINDTDNTIDFFVFGHRHVLTDYPVAGHSRLIFLGDWIHHFSYAVFNGTDMEIKHF